MHYFFIDALLTGGATSIGIPIYYKVYNYLMRGPVPWQRLSGGGFNLRSEAGDPGYAHDHSGMFRVHGFLARAGASFQFTRTLMFKSNP